MDDGDGVPHRRVCRWIAGRCTWEPGVRRDTASDLRVVARRVTVWRAGAGVGGFRPVEAEGVVDGPVGHPEHYEFGVAGSEVVPGPRGEGFFSCGGAGWHAGVARLARWSRSKPR